MSEVTLGELSRRLDALKSDTQESVRRAERECESRAASHVPAPLFQVAQERNEERLASVVSAMADLRIYLVEKIAEEKKDLMEDLATLKEENISLKREIKAEKDQKRKLMWGVATGIIMPTIVGLVILLANILVEGGTA